MVQGARAMEACLLNGRLSNFVGRIENKIDDKRLDFCLGFAVVIER